MDRDRETGGDEEGAEGNKIKRTPQVSEGSFFCCQEAGGRKQVAGREQKVQEERAYR